MTSFGKTTAWLIAAVASGALSASHAQTALPPEPPHVMRASDFRESIGVNLHLEYTDSGYANVAAVLDDMKFLGLDQVRDGCLDPHNQGQDHYDVAAAAGLKFDFIVFGSAPIAPTLGLIDAFAARHPGAVVAIEGPNEINNWPVTYLNQTGIAAAQAFQAELFKQSHAAGLHFTAPVYALTSWPDVGGAADFANVHIYPKHGDQPFVTLSAEADLERRVMPGQPLVLTETGYYTLPGAFAWGGVDEATHAKMLLNLLFDAQRLGISRSYIYQLLDGYRDPKRNDSEKHFGLFDADNRPKPAAIALHNLTRLIADPGANAAAFALTPVNVQIKGLSGAGGSLILEMSDGRIDLVLWDEPRIWNDDNHAATTAPATPATVTLDRRYATLKVYDPLQGEAPILSILQSKSLTVRVPDHPILIELTGATHP